MNHHGHSMLPLIFLLSSLLAFLPANSGRLSQPVGDLSAAERASIYIVHVRKPEHMLSAGPEEVEEWHKSFLPSATLDTGEPRMVFSYKVVISGFAARLTAEEIRAMETKEGFLYAQPDEEVIPQTTDTPDFLKLRGNVWEAANRGKGAIIGVVDTGIDHKHASFFRDAMPNPLPPRWKGWCFFEEGRACNDKLLGATYLGIFSPDDEGGHGTHVAGIAAGLEVEGASVHGYAKGTAAGAAPDAYLAIYKADTACEMLWSIERAIEDGVHILSISMSITTKAFYANAIAIGALAAVRHGILVSCAASNSGPSPSTVRNDAPWIMTVGASTMGRVLLWTVKVDNGDNAGLTIEGESLHGTEITADIVYPGANGQEEAMTCSNLDNANVAGKVVMCLQGGYTTAKKARVVREANGVAMVLMNTEHMGSIVSEIPDVAIPTVAINHPASRRLIEYVDTATYPARLIPSLTEKNNSPFPAVAWFSGRGPSLENGGILKPDILGPGVNILSAKTKSTRGFVLKSGTSMATPHLSGIAAILKLHLPAETGLDWTPAMIRSAIMTTANSSNSVGEYITDETDQPAPFFAVGAGHVNPPAALDPGLVYNLHFRDYVGYLRGLGYTDRQMYVTAGVDCTLFEPIEPEQLNYPSISVSLTSTIRTRTVKRTATNMRAEPSTYSHTVDILTAEAVEVSVSPDVLVFEKLNERKSFKVTFSAVDVAGWPEEVIVEGYLRWVSNTNTVTNPFLVTYRKTGVANLL